ncbi:Ger(x)C family spore germination protein [Paenibacillus agri]|uniref:Ger(X)C family spore germination protein n=1 Tax=Paenibacillus agri TaxID=2744309 RepID=A0A850EHC3_9BACL|nr:Ger(x)C family spore germination protein [Paenibacillus agri]NUU60743.1 Ger(x)C family spore germination protein [Paenibacillus agri]
MKRRIIPRLLLAFCLPCLLSGCWDIKDINKRYLPVVMGICDGKTETYHVTLQVPTVTGTTQILEQEAKSISKALDLIRTKSEKHVDLLHLRLILISEKMAEKGIDDIIDYAIRADDISIKGMVAIVTGDFQKALHHQVGPTPEVSSYDYFSEEAGWTPNVSLVRLWEAYKVSRSYTQDTAIPLVEAGTDTLYEFRGSAIMRNSKMVGTLTPDETLINNIFSEKYTGGTIETAEDASILIKKATVRHRIKWGDSGPQLNSKLHLDIEVSENKQGLSNQEITEEIKTSIEKRGANIIDKLHTLKADVLGIGQLFKPKMTVAQLKEWKERWYPKLQSKIEVEINIRNNIYLKDKLRENNLRM